LQKAEEAAVYTLCSLCFILSPLFYAV